MGRDRADQPMPDLFSTDMVREVDATPTPPRRQASATTTATNTSSQRYILPKNLSLAIKQLSDGELDQLLKTTNEEAKRRGRPLRSETELIMKTYVASIGAKAVMAFRAEDDDQASAIIDDQDGSMRSDLKELVGTDGKPLWDGKSAIEAREATAAQHAEWEQSRDQAISDSEIDLDAGDDPDEWNVYLMSTPQTKKIQPTD